MSAVDFDAATNDPAFEPKRGWDRGVLFSGSGRYPLELLRFPADRGAARWHARTDRLFPDIDHTAIAVADTERSLMLFRDALGLAITGESLNSARSRKS